MKENTLYWINIFKKLFNDILKKTLIMFILGSIIIFCFQHIRFNPVAYIIVFFICLGLNFFLYFRKPVVKNEFKENQ